jgi:hypothetical protein
VSVAGVRGDEPELRRRHRPLSDQSRLDEPAWRSAAGLRARSRARATGRAIRRPTRTIATTPEPGRLQRVVPYVMDTKNALVMRFEPPRPGPEMAGLQAAFKQAIQQQFQLESRELACEPMPSPPIAGDPVLRVFRGRRRCPASAGGGSDRGPAARSPRSRDLSLRSRHPGGPGTESCGKACYECLLDYGNQPDHKDLDRLSIRDLLAELARAEVRPAAAWARAPSGWPRCASAATAARTPLAGGARDPKTATPRARRNT